MLVPQSCMPLLPVWCGTLVLQSRGSRVSRDDCERPMEKHLMLGITAQSLDDRCPSVMTWSTAALRGLMLHIARSSGGSECAGMGQLLQELWFHGECSVDVHFKALLLQDV